MKRVLLVEDNAVNRILVTTLLKREGYRVLVAVTGTQGVEMALTEKPDLILMDIELPEIDGIEAARRIKADPATADIPIVALTGRNGESDIRDAFGAGFSGYETKPISHSRLVLKVNSFLEEHN